MSTSPTMAERVDAYLRERRHAGYALRIEGEQLARFARFAEQAHAERGTLTLALAVAWATSSARQSPLTAARRIEVLRPFARYCHRHDLATQIPARAMFGQAHRRLTPHIYTEAEIQDLLAACTTLYQGSLRGVTCATVFGLIAACGLRIAEATGLQRADVDLDRGLLHVQHAKFGKSRWVPMHPSTTAALQRYAAQRDRDVCSAEGTAFFLFDGGRCASTRALHYAFVQLRRHLAWRARGAHGAPRVHDLRHTFVCKRLLRWYTEHRDIDRHILALSTYVGHAKVTDTYWYVTATPELLAVAATRFESYARGGS